MTRRPLMPPELQNPDHTCRALPLPSKDDRNRCRITRSGRGHDTWAGSGVARCRVPCAIPHQSLHLAFEFVGVSGGKVTGEIMADIGCGAAADRVPVFHEGRLLGVCRVPTSHHQAGYEHSAKAVGERLNGGIGGGSSESDLHLAMHDRVRYTGHVAESLRILRDCLPDAPGLSRFTYT